MKVGKAAAATAVAGLVLLGTGGSASALTLDLSGIGGLVRDTTNGVSALLGGTPATPHVDTPAVPAEVGTDGIRIQVGDLLDVQVGTNVPAAPATPALPELPDLPATPAVPATPAIPATPALPEMPIKLPVASIPETPDSVQALRDFALIDIDFVRTDVEGMAMTIFADGQGWVESGSAFAYRTAGMTVDLAGLTAIRLMVASAYEQINEATGGVAS